MKRDTIIGHNFTEILLGTILKFILNVYISTNRKVTEKFIKYADLA